MSDSINDSNHNLHATLVLYCILVFMVRLVTGTLAMASAAICNVLKKKEITGQPSSLLGRLQKTAAADNENNVSAVRKETKTTVCGISNNLQRAGMKVSQAFKAL